MAIVVDEVETIGNLIADQRQLGGRKMPRQIQRGDAVEVEPGAVKHVRIRDFLVRQTDRDDRAVVADDQAQLLFDIGAEQVGARDR